MEMPDKTERCYVPWTDEDEDDKVWLTRDEAKNISDALHDDRRVWLARLLDERIGDK